MIGSAQAANSLLRAIFDRGERVTLDRLQALLLLLDLDWEREHGAPLIGEPFLAADSGPRIPHIDSQYGYLGTDQPVERFCKDAEGRASMAGGEVAETAQCVMESTSDVSTAALIVEMVQPGTAWSRARSAGVRFLHEVPR